VYIDENGCEVTETVMVDGGKDERNDDDEQESGSEENS